MTVFITNSCQDLTRNQSACNFICRSRLNVEQLFLNLWSQRTKPTTTPKGSTESFLHIKSRAQRASETSCQINWKFHKSTKGVLCLQWWSQSCFKKSFCQGTSIGYDLGCIYDAIGLRGLTQTSLPANALRLRTLGHIEKQHCLAFFANRFP